MQSLISINMYLQLASTVKWSVRRLSKGRCVFCTFVVLILFMDFGAPIWPVSCCGSGNRNNASNRNLFKSDSANEEKRYEKQRTKSYQKRGVN